MRAPSPTVESRRSDAKDGRLSTVSQAMGGAPRRGDLGPCGGATQVGGDGAAYADGLLLGEGISEDVEPLTRASAAVLAFGLPTERMVRVST